jgi:hypothetical protein
MSFVRGEQNQQLISLNISIWELFHYVRSGFNINKAIFFKVVHFLAICTFRNITWLYLYGLLLLRTLYLKDGKGKSKGKAVPVLTKYNAMKMYWWVEV